MRRIITWLVQSRAAGTTTVVFECRRCGTTLDGDRECPVCGDDDVARYEIH